MMKKLIFSALALFALAACNKAPEAARVSESALTFRSSIASSSLRVTGDGFDAGDAVGIRMTGDATKDNAKYVTAAGGATAKFAPADVANKLVLPPKGGAANFTGYYPYNDMLSGNSLPIDVKNHPADVLFSDNLRNVTSSRDLTLQFRHMLSRVTFAMDPAAGLIIKSASLKGVATQTTMDVTTGTLTAAAAPDEVALNNGSVILVPAANAGVELHITTHDDRNYKYVFASDLVLESGKSYVYTLKMQGGQIVVDEINGTIADWNSVEGGDSSLNPDQNPITPPIPVTPPAGENPYGVDLMQTPVASVRVGSGDFWPMADRSPVNLPGWLNKAVEGTHVYERRNYGGIAYAQISAHRDTAPSMKAVLVTPRIRMTEGKIYKLDVTYSSGWCNGAVLAIQLLDKNGDIVKNLQVIDATGSSGYHNEHAEISLDVTGVPEAGYIAFFYQGGQSPLHTTTYQIEKISIQ